ncbi:uracil-DNA glycosylase family protein, partial [Marinomonas agarivorans]
PKNKQTLTEKVKAWREYTPSTILLPHPSPRNNIWLKRNPWFEEELVPELKKRVRHCLSA